MKENKNLRRTGVFWAVTIGYGLFYVCRLSFNVLKKNIVDEGLLTESQLGIIGSALFFSYAIGKLVNGSLADRLNIRYFMSGALLICALVNLVLGFKMPFYLFVGLWAINGWFQSVGSPSSVVGLKRWFKGDNFGSVYGYWSASHNIGGSLTYLIVGTVVGTYGWQAGFFSASFMGLVGALLVFFLLIPFPSSSNTSIIIEAPLIVNKNVGKKQLEVLKNPMIWMLAASSSFMYVARYAMDSWGIFYFQIEKGYDIKEASTLITLNTGFGVLGTVSSGLISEKLFKGNRVLMALILSAMNLVALCVFLMVPNGILAVDIFCMILFGISIGALICFLGGLMAVDIAPVEATGMAIGVIGIASYIGAGIQDIISGWLIESQKTMVHGAKHYDFSHFRYFWLISAAISLLLLFIIWNINRTKKYNQSEKSITEVAQ
jgi:OPA family sugar phosphate sensor protein UhpC-like MFS transporter